MIKHFKLRSIILKCIFIYGFISLIKPAILKSQDIFLLSPDEMEGYELIRQKESLWEIDPNRNTKIVVEQKWQIIGRDPNSYIHICYAEFETISESILKTAYAEWSNAGVYLWGSFDGPICGDMSWIAYSGGALYFVRGNIGIMVFLPLYQAETDKPILVEIASKLLKKVETNLSPQILSFEEAVKQIRIPMSVYQSITDPVIRSEVMDGFLLHSTWDSKWLPDTSSVTAGIRKEWKDGQGAIVGIDIGLFQSSPSAMSASELRSLTSRSGLFNLDDLDIFQSILNSWQEYFNSGLPKNLFSIVGVQGKIAIHFYQYNPNGIDKEFVINVVEELSTQVMHFLDHLSENLSAEGVQSYPNPFNQCTTILYKVPEDAYVTIIVYNIQGQIVSNLFKNLFHETGFHAVEWDAGNLPSGEYICRIEANNYSIMKKMILSR